MMMVFLQDLHEVYLEPLNICSEVNLHHFVIGLVVSIWLLSNRHKLLRTPFTSTIGMHIFYRMKLNELEGLAKA